MVQGLLHPANPYRLGVGQYLYCVKGVRLDSRVIVCATFLMTMPPALPFAHVTQYHGDSISIKGDFSWSRASSPQSMSPEIDINSLLTQINRAPRNFETPDPLDKDISSPHVGSGSVSARPEAPSANFARSRNRQSSGGTMEERLVTMPEKRTLPWRDGVEPGAENETGGESRRKQIRFGCLLATRGEVQALPCNSCANGRGKFSVCISLPNFFKGACASCQLSGRPNRCSIKKKDDPPESPNSASRLLRTPNVVDSSPSTALQKSPVKGTQVKRRRTTAPIASTPMPEWENLRHPQWDQDLGNSSRRLVNMGQQPWASVKLQATTSNTSGVLNGRNSGASGVSDALEQRSSLAWPSVNQPSNIQMYHSQENSSAGFRNERNTREGTVGHEDANSFVLIDTLPRGKQRQVYGLISGIQGGIDHLQHELNSLKKALGIDDED
ncbi:BgTH12-01483 [Blumeria graminis f. sp. triticale]|uniref:BgTH12-01483 n=1 Tax=Blumeria graminis f. sp. triticale TaxID=1689686 RepID=A0A9W4CZ60_BLUGR|nr:BgTH12-01483 [Blumeria graminis f. sp. triticale]